VPSMSFLEQPAKAVLNAWVDRRLAAPPEVDSRSLGAIVL
jgi:hypothetical protein